MRQHWYGAGGFSYKSTWTLQELCPLSILVVNFYQLRKNTIRDKKKRKSETENGNGTEGKGKGHSVYHSDITAVCVDDGGRGVVYFSMKRFV